MARKGDLKTVLHVNVGLDDVLAKQVMSNAEAFERTWTQEVRYQLRRAYGLDQTPTEEKE